MRSQTRADKTNLPKRQKPHRIPYKKERFLQSNHKFAIYPSYYESYNQFQKKSLFDATIETSDVIIDWNYVAQVTYTTHKPYDCPICLYPPTCPRIIPCGHVVCWPCVYRYFNTRKRKKATQNKGKLTAPCPVCQIQIELQDFRSAILVHQEKCKVGKSVMFKLLRRLKDSTIIDLVTNYSDQTEGTKEFSNIFRIPSTSEQSAYYNRVTIAADLKDILSREEIELQEGIDLALSSGEEAQSLLDAKDLWEEFHETSLKNLVMPQAIKCKMNTPLALTEHDYYYLYVMDGGHQHVYLHPLCYSWLLKQYEDPTRLPTVIEGIVIDLEDECTQDENTRKRYKFLSHLPISCNFQLCLLDVSSFLTDPVHLDGFLNKVQEREINIQNEKLQKDKYEEQQIKRSLKYRGPNDVDLTLMMTEGLPLPAPSQAFLLERFNNIEYIPNDPSNFPSLPGNSNDTENIGENDAPTDKDPTKLLGEWGDGRSLAETIVAMKREEQRKNSRDCQFPELVPSSSNSTVPESPKNNAWVILGSPKTKTSTPTTILSPGRGLTISSNPSWPSLSSTSPSPHVTVGRGEFSGGSRGRGTSRGKKVM